MLIDCNKFNSQSIIGKTKFKFWTPIVRSRFIWKICLASTLCKLQINLTAAGTEKLVRFVSSIWSIVFNRINLLLINCFQQFLVKLTLLEAERVFEYLKPITQLAPIYELQVYGEEIIEQSLIRICSRFLEGKSAYYLIIRQPILMDAEMWLFFIILFI